MVPLLPTQPSFRAQADQLPRGLEIIHRTPPAAWNILATGRGVLLGTACRGGMDAVQPLWASLQSTGPHLCGLKHKRSKNINLTQGLSQHHVAFVSFPGDKGHLHLLHTVTPCCVHRDSRQGVGWGNTTGQWRSSAWQCPGPHTT